jgi:hypothetical protein
LKPYLPGGNTPAVFGMFTKIGLDRLYGQSWEKSYENNFDDIAAQLEGRNAILLASVDPFDVYDNVTDKAIQLVCFVSLVCLVLKHSTQFADKMKMLNDLGIPVIIRPAHEMNGPWYSYGQQPTKFKVEIFF